MAKRVLLFAYDFPHRKSEDLLLEMHLAGADIAAVVAAPRRELPAHATWSAYRALPQLPAHHPRDVTRRLGVDYHVCAHEDADAVGRIVRDTGADIAVIGGARILLGAVIARFTDGVINYHPGPIPQTSGLDSLYWMIERDAPAGVTAHFIDHRVDAGWEISFEPVTLVPDETLTSLHYKLYQAQLVAHRKIVQDLVRGVELARRPLDRPTKNQPMDDAGRRRAAARFATWLNQNLARPGRAAS